MSLRLLGYRRTKAVAERLAPLAPSRETTVEQAERISYLVRVAANRGVCRANCLPQSLVTWALLRREGIDSVIQLGARKESEKLEAHAWVECFGLRLGESPSAIPYSEFRIPNGT